MTPLELIAEHLRREARKHGYFHTGDIAEAVGLTMKQAGFWMGVISRENPPGLRITRYSGRRGTVWWVEIV